MQIVFKDGIYEDGTEGTRDYRALSALYLMLRVSLVGVFITVVVVLRHRGSRYIIGIFHVFLGTFFFIAKPYKESWMNFVDGSIITLIEVLILMTVATS